MTVREFTKWSSNIGGINVLPQDIVSSEYFKMCKRLNRVPSNDGFNQFDQLVHMAINVRGSI